MYRSTINFHNRLARGEKPTIYVLIHTAIGWRSYGKKALKNIFDVDNLYLADGTYTADGSIHAGSDSSYGVIDNQGRIVDMSGLERTLSPKKENMYTGFQVKQVKHLNVSLDNRDRHFSRIIPTEPFLGQGMFAYAGFEDTPFAEHRQVFGGIISEIEMSSGLMKLEASEE